jgi:hypothetical protein
MFLDVWRAVSSCPEARPILATTALGDFPVEIAAENVWLQGDGDLGARLERIIRRGLLSASAVVAIGADSPIITASQLDSALDKLRESDAVIGPCTDGGFYLLGLRRCPPGLFSNLSWSASHTLDAVTRRIEEHKLKLARIEPLFDVDVADDLAHLEEYLRHKPFVAPATRAWYSENRGFFPSE